MKKLLLLFSAILSMGVLSAQDLKLDEILAKYSKESGQDKLAKINTARMTGKMLQAEMEFLITSTEKRPGFDRTDIEFQGTKIVYVFDGETGWSINPVSGSMDPQDMSADMISSSKKEELKDPFSNWNNPLVNWKKNGSKIELVGREDMNGTPVYNIRMTFNENESVNYYMDIVKFVIYKSTQKSLLQGQLMDVESRFSDFRDVDGVMNPFRYETLYNGQPGMVITVEKIEYNLPVDDAIFKKPEINKK
jgi:hypothetical protein